MIKVQIEKEVNLKFEIDPNYRTAILGENGIGKTTILKSIFKRGSESDFVDTFVPENLTLSYFSQIKEDLNYAKSGGEITKDRLVKLFENQSDIYILDEPTNNLDQKNISWLQDYILKNNLRIIFTSHDINFLDSIAECIFYIDNKSVEKTKDKCSSYLVRRKQKVEREYLTYEINLKKKEDLLNASKETRQKGERGLKWESNDKDKFLKGFNRNSAGKGLKKARILEERSENIFVDKPRFDPIIQISFNQKEFMPRDLFSIVSRSILQKKIYIELSTGDKYLIYGRNGSGKTTFLNYLDKLLSDKVVAEPKDIFNKKSNFNYEYITQDWYEKLDSVTVEKFFEEDNIEIKDQYKILNLLYLDKNILKKKFKEISPGTRIKVLIGILSAKNLDLIIWDEPTNHMDPMTQIVIKEALEKSNCAIILVSHDQTYLKSESFKEVSFD